MINPPDIDKDKETFLTQQTLSFNKNQTLMTNEYCGVCDSPIEADSPFYIIGLTHYCRICKDKRNELMEVIELR